MTKHWIHLILAVGVITVALSQFVFAVIDGEWNPWKMFLSALCALVWAPSANKHYEAIWEHVESRRRNDDEPTD